MSCPPPSTDGCPPRPPHSGAQGGPSQCSPHGLPPLLTSVMAPSALGVAHEALEPFLALPRVSSHHVFLLTASSHPGLLSILQVDRFSL